MHRKSPDPEALKARLIALRETVRRRALGLEARFAKRREPLERARQEFLKHLEHLRQREAEGRYPSTLLKPALLREELRLKHLENELVRLEEALNRQLALLWSKARGQAARALAKAGVNLDLDELFPEGKP